MDDSRSLVDPRVRAALDDLGAAWEAMACDPELADTVAFCAHYGVPLSESANTILVASKDDPPRRAACVALATTRLDVNHVVRRLLGVKRLSFAPAEETAAVTGMLIGGVTPFALPDGLPVYVDSRVMARDRIVLGGGNRSSKVRLAPGELKRLRAVQVVEGLATER